MTETIVLTTEESDALEQCHDILRERYEELGELYDKENQDRCEWWLLGILKFDGIDKLMLPCKPTRKSV